MASDTHKYVGLHAQEVNGHFVGNGDTLALSKSELSDPFVAELIEEGKLLPLKGGEK